MTTLKSPYRKPEERDHIIIFRVPRETFTDVFIKRCPHRGAIDGVMGQLYSKFYAALLADTTIPTTYDTDNDTRIATLLDRCTFSLAPVPGHQPDVGGGTPRVHRNKPAVTKLPANPPRKTRNRK